MTYKELNDEFFKFSLDKIFFNSFRVTKDEKRMFSGRQSFELFITPECNLSCTYCYLQKHKNDLYPSEFLDREIILNNIGAVLRWAKKEKFYFRDLELFSGEIWHTDFGISVLDVIYNNFLDYIPTKTIMIPTNGSFIKSNYYKSKIEYYMSKFSELGVRLCVSFSIDGAVIEEKSRPQNSGAREEIDKFYDDLFMFHKKHKNLTGLHPMVSSTFSKHFIENHIWWFEQAKKYGFSPLEGIMFLEVRDNDWTEESIEDYKKYIEWQFYYKYENILNRNKVEMCNHIFKLRKDNNNTLCLYKQNNRISCAIQNSLTIRCGDLAIVPCHRLSYKHLVLGHLIKDSNNEISNITSNNPEFAFRIWSCNPKTSMTLCDSCHYKLFCPKGCLGSQYESMLDPFAPSDSVCKLYKTKIDTIISLCKKEDLFEFLKNKELFDSRQNKNAQEIIEAVNLLLEKI